MERQEEQHAAPDRGGLRRARLRLAACLAAIPALSALVWFAMPGEPVTFGEGVELTATDVSYEVERGTDVQVTLNFLARGPLHDDALVFVHLSGQNGCGVALDTAPVTPTRQWRAGQSYVHGVQVPLPSGCRADQIVELFAGLYFPKTGARLPLLTPKISDSRIRVGATEVVSKIQREGERHLEGAAVAQRAALSRRTAWLPMLILLAVALSITAAAWRSGGLSQAESRNEPTSSGARWRQRLLFALPALPFFVGMLMVLEFIKDDAYISFRYAHNLVRGQGLVFNSGERLEGMTNFLWTLLLAPFEALNLDLFQVCEVLGAGLGAACLVFVARLTLLLQEEKSDLASYLWGAFWLASSSSFVLYANSGLEQPLAALLPCWGAFVLYQSRVRWRAGAEERRVERSYAGAGLLLGAACLVRPELHMSAVLIALPAIVDVVRARRLGRPELWLALGVLAPTVPAHAFRWFYYGTLIPNTFYVKTSSDGTVLAKGLETLQDMFLFNHTGLLLVLAPFAFLSRARLFEKLACLSVALAFLFYYARVGVDEMQWHRLYIPALPFVCALSATGAQNLITRLRLAVAPTLAARRVLASAAWLALLFWMYGDMKFTHDTQGGFNGHGDLAGTFHPDMAKFLVRHERPGGLVAFQDMGSTPYYAPDLNFLDFFGLVDKTVAHARHGHGLHTFIAGDPAAQRAYDAEMREYFFGRNPEWTIMTVYASAAERSKVAHAYSLDPTGGAFGNFYRNNSWQFALWDDRRFHERYVPVRTWPRSAAYYLALFRRRDLWEQTPREVVLDAPPPEAQQVVARFDGGLELLGSSLTPEVRERHEAFVTSWWRLPGPMARDLMFFTHFVRQDARTQLPSEHVPGDWMYPADRWQPGQILEDRMLFQLPPETMLAGDYSVYLGVYNRSTGARLHVTAGKSDGADRVPLGTLHVAPLMPLVHDLIPRTDVTKMRAHPERIIVGRPELAELSR